MLLQLAGTVKDARQARTGTQTAFSAPPERTTRVHSEWPSSFQILGIYPAKDVQAVSKLLESFFTWTKRAKQTQTALHTKDLTAFRTKVVGFGKWPGCKVGIDIIRGHFLHQRVPVLILVTLISHVCLTRQGANTVQSWEVYHFGIGLMRLKLVTPQLSSSQAAPPFGVQWCKPMSRFLHWLPMVSGSAALLHFAVQHLPSPRIQGVSSSRAWKYHFFESWKSFFKFLHS